jgi:2-phospho-L-lactate/phosphoenolpyruvate guanylyltransferase
MNASHKIIAAIPVKETTDAKQRLADVLPGVRRQQLALAMLEDVLTALVRVPELAGILVVTADRAAASLAARHGAHILAEGASNGHTGAARAAAHRLAAEGCAMLQIPGDVPLIEPEDVSRIIAAHGSAPAFTIVPARDEQGSNAVLCSPADAVPLRFGEDSYFPHLAAAGAHGIEPAVVRLPHIALDIDTPEDLALFLATPSRTRARALLERWRIVLPASIEATA